MVLEKQIDQRVVLLGARQDEWSGNPNRRAAVGSEDGFVWPCFRLQQQANACERIRSAAARARLYHGRQRSRRLMQSQVDVRFGIKELAQSMGLCRRARLEQVAHLRRRGRELVS